MEGFRVKEVRGSRCDAVDLGKGTDTQKADARAEEGGRNAQLREKFDIATARAVAALPVLSEYCLPFVKVGGWMMALKGPGLDDELSEAQFALNTLGGRFARAETVEIPGRDWSHRIAYIEKVKPTHDKYPRKAGVPAKNPLGSAKK
jgi:16S rRNA (guanine527-N7)-methyltransferase